MFRQMSKNEFRRNRFIPVTITLLIAIAALVTALAAQMTFTLSRAIDRLMEQAKTPHFMQMHGGEADEQEIAEFAAGREEVEAFQILPFYNVPGARIVNNGQSLAASVQDNGFSVQPQKFDYLFDLDGTKIDPEEGELYLPLYYYNEKFAVKGDRLTVAGIPFHVAGYVRDSQMNPAMSSSKRFIVHPADLEKLKAAAEMESLIEFRLKDLGSISNFSTAYTEAGLDANGPSLTWSLFKLANGISDGTTIVVLLLLALLLLVITFLCVRFALMAKMEEDYREIGVMKAIGIRVSSIRKMYFHQYFMMTVAGCLIGVALSLPLLGRLTDSLELLYGPSDNPTSAFLFALPGALLIGIPVLLYVWKVLGRFKKISAVEAIRNGAPEEKKTKATRILSLNNSRGKCLQPLLAVKDVLARRKLYRTVFLVFLIASFMMILPQNLYSTISHPSFIGYLGLGESDLLFNIQGGEQVDERGQELLEALRQDGEVADAELYLASHLRAKNADGESLLVPVSFGEQEKFSAKYSQGKTPGGEGEIALSVLVADELKKNVHDTLELMRDGEWQSFTVSGIYSDITNGGKTLKLSGEPWGDEFLWAAIPVVLKEGVSPQAVIERYQAQFPGVKGADSAENTRQMLGPMQSSLQGLRISGVIAALAVTFLIVYLFVRMLVIKDTRELALQKILGSTDRELKRQILLRMFFLAITAAILGAVLASTLGEFVGSAMISSFGAASLKFVLNIPLVLFLGPLVLSLVTIPAVYMGSRALRTFNLAESLKE